VSEPIFGIDLGTTNSCLAVLEAGGPRVVDIDDQPTVPSVVSLDRGSGEIIVGRRALNRRLLAPESTVRSIKRWMGRQEPVELGGRKLLPEEIAAEILRYLKSQGERALGRPVRRAVITVPAYFGDAQRRATLRAGELAGLEVPRLLNEPTAAALIYDRLVLRDAGAAGAAPPAAAAAVAAVTAGRLPAGDVQRVLVYDLGGGTFDVSVVEIGGEISEVRASTGDNQLGGDDFDQLLADFLLRQVRERFGRDLSADRRALARLGDAAERAKIDLSSRPYTRVIEEGLGGELNLDLEIERSAFEEMIEAHLARTMAEVDRALEEAKLDADRIDRVILMGGSTHIPRIVELIEERFDCPVEHTVDPALGVALGAAVQGAILGGRVFDQILVDVAAHSLGIKTSDDVMDASRLRDADHFSTIIRRNTQIPASRSEVYYTVVHHQRRVQVEVYQGEHPRCSENTLIGDFAFELLPAPAHSPVLVEFKYDLDGIIRVVVSQKGTDRRKEMTLRTRRLEEDQGAESLRAVDNYILRKAQALAAALPSGEAQRRLHDAAAAYAAALESEATLPAEMEKVEDRLLALIDELEEPREER
jgi:molecular chaperone DnaK